MRALFVFLSWVRTIILSFFSLNIVVINDSRNFVIPRYVARHWRSHRGSIVALR